MKLTPSQFKQEARVAMAIKLFEMRKLSSGMAATLAGIDRVTFLLLLSHYGVSLMIIDAEELQSDFDNA